MSARVFVASLPTRFDAATKEHVPSLDLNPATDHGELVIITRGPQATGDELDEAIDLVDATVGALSHNHYRFEQGDSILMVGDPILNGIAIAAALDVGQGDHPNDHKPVAVLRWDRRNHKYDRVIIPG